MAVDADNLLLNGGTVQFLSGFTTLHENRGISLGAGHGTLLTDANTDVVYAGVMSGAGDFTKSGAGTLTLTGVNTFTGGTDLAAGSLYVGN